MSKSIVHVRRKKKDTDALRSTWHILEEWFEVNRRQILIVSGVAVGLVLVTWLAYYFFDYRYEQRQQAFDAAYEKFTATVSTGETPTTPVNLFGETPVTYPDAQTKFTESAAAFEQLAGDYSSMRDVANYYAGLSYLEIDPEKGVAKLQPLAEGGSEVKHQARLALGEYFLKAGDFEKAEQQLAALSDDPGRLPRMYVLTQLAKTKERLNKPAEAAPLFKEVVDVDRNSEYGIEAEKGLQRVDPAAAAALPPKTPTPAPGTNPSFTNQSFPGR